MTSLGGVLAYLDQELPNGSLMLTFPLCSLAKMPTLFSRDDNVHCDYNYVVVVIDAVDGQERSGKNRMMDKKQEREWKE